MKNDLISRSALLEKIRICKKAVGDCANHDYMIGYASALSGVEGQICAEPAVDAVEVARCKDCKHRGFAGECPMCYTEDAYDEDYGYDYWDVDKTVDEGFCHCGEKWDEEVEG